MQHSHEMMDSMNRWNKNELMSEEDTMKAKEKKEEDKFGAP